MQRCAPRRIEAETSMSLPINILDDKMIENALAKAIKDENYELASRINEEIKRRKDKQK